ncbi:hypothetical protein JFL43_19530 [Viridibacillus sp. YIM B01967]|uniref:Uncharacterized protein n=1 Tax=Viridibacillus soli TaxID=2798301 RepID=A0ABS1HC92_9BACL|nr:hypothetical protein [Viridibacillus soli]MBK3496995.1 hypothetical protein [Viridibacillus soli]
MELEQLKKELIYALPNPTMRAVVAILAVENPTTRDLIVLKHHGDGELPPKSEFIRISEVPPTYMKLHHQYVIIEPSLLHIRGQEALRAYGALC